MENPYWKAEVKPHFLDREAVRTKCFDIFNIISASIALAGQYAMAEADEGTEPSSMFKLHHRLAERRLSQLMLEIALLVRTFDDLMNSTSPDPYAEFLARTGGDDSVGECEGNALKLRDACNKIIHATDFRPVYDYEEREFEDQEIHRIWYLDGQIELEGTLGQNNWEATLFVETFLEVVLKTLEFVPIPERAQGATLTTLEASSPE